MAGKTRLGSVYAATRQLVHADSILFFAGLHYITIFRFHLQGPNSDLGFWTRLLFDQVLLQFDPGSTVIL